MEYRQGLIDVILYSVIYFLNSQEGTSVVECLRDAFVETGGIRSNEENCTVNMRTEKYVIKRMFFS